MAGKNAHLDRCDREIAEICNRVDVASGRAPAWLVTLGIEDWECEKRLLLVGRSPFDGSRNPTEAKA